MDIELRRRLADLRKILVVRESGVGKSWLSMRYTPESLDEIWEIAKQKRCGLYLEIHRGWPSGHQYYKMHTTQEGVFNTSLDWSHITLGNYVYESPIIDFSRMETAGSHIYITET